MNKETISEYYLERYALGELSEEDAEKFGRVASSDPELQAVLKRIESSNQEILALYPPLTVRASLQSLLEDARSKSFSFKRVLVISSAAIFLLTLILVLPLLKEKSGIIYPGAEQDTTLIKGIPKVDLSRTQLLVYRKTQDQVEMLSDGEEARTGDLLQLGYVTVEESYGVILSIDGRGTITLHYPEDKGKSTKLEQNKQFLLPNAIELDNAPDFERFFFLTSESPIDVNDILNMLEDLAKSPSHVKRTRLELPGNFKQYSILILKGEGS